MVDINLPCNIVRDTERRWERTLQREAMRWKDRHAKSMRRTAMIDRGHVVPVEIKPRRDCMNAFK
jgi:hypothetical protein